jgi:hypothetical protein
MELTRTYARLDAMLPRSVPHGLLEHPFGILIGQAGDHVLEFLSCNFNRGATAEAIVEHSLRASAV